MTNMFLDVKEFQTAVGQNVSDKPELPDPAERELRIRLLKEEYEEYIQEKEIKL